MTAGDDLEFRPRPGRIRARGDGHAKTHIQRVLRELDRIGHGRFRTTAKNGLGGTRIGRGAGAGEMAKLRGAPRGALARRVIVKTHIARIGTRGAAAARLHLRYIQRDGVGRDGRPGRLYDARCDEADGEAFRERSKGDRHQFRIIVSAEDAVEFGDLKVFTRELTRRMERDLGTRLDWVAVDHYDTGHPHTHLIVRGRDDRRKDLVIARDYIAEGMRIAASEIMTLELGPRSEIAIRQAMRAEVGQQRLTTLDRAIVVASEDGVFDARFGPRDAMGRFRHALKLDRLRQLERLGLARTTAPGIWELSPRLEETLRRMGERGDIVKTMHRQLRAAGVQRSPADLRVYDTADRDAKPVVGRVAAMGVADELRDRRYLVVDGLDGRAHYIRLPEAVDAPDLARDAIVEIAPPRREPRPVDRTIAAIAAANDGLYSDAAHARADPSASAEFRATHIRRLEAMRLANLVARRSDGSWIVEPDYATRATAHDAGRKRRSAIEIKLLSAWSLAAQVDTDGATWLDRQLVGTEPARHTRAGFGREVDDALDQRRRWLVAQGLASERDGQTRYRRNLLASLRARELQRVGSELSAEMGKPFVAAGKGERIEGIYRRPVALASGRFALIEKSHEFTLAPWRPVLERNLGKHVAGVLRGDSVSWTLTRKRGLGIG